MVLRFQFEALVIKLMANLTGELNQGLGPMLSVRGEGVLSWIGSDNFVVEDKTAATHEVVSIPHLLFCPIIYSLEQEKRFQNLREKESLGILFSV